MAAVVTRRSLKGMHAARIGPQGATRADMGGETAALDKFTCTGMVTFWLFHSKVTSEEAVPFCTSARVHRRSHALFARLRHRRRRRQAEEGRQEEAAKHFYIWAAAVSLSAMQSLFRRRFKSPRHQTPPTGSNAPGSAD